MITHEAEFVYVSPRLLCCAYLYVARKFDHEPWNVHTIRFMCLGLCATDVVGTQATTQRKNASQMMAEELDTYEPIGMLYNR